MRESDLPYADAVRAYLVKANLQRANLQKAFHGVAPKLMAACITRGLIFLKTAVVDLITKGYAIIVWAKAIANHFPAISRGKFW